MLKPNHCLFIAYTEAFQIVNANSVAGKVQQSILEHASVAIREHKAIAVDPIRIDGVKGHDLVE